MSGVVFEIHAGWNLRETNVKEPKTSHRKLFGAQAPVKTTSPRYRSLGGSMVWWVVTVRQRSADSIHLFPV